LIIPNQASRLLSVLSSAPKNTFPLLVIPVKIS
jgi:hypothetical protein